MWFSRKNSAAMVVGAVMVTLLGCGGGGGGGQGAGVPVPDTQSVTGRVVDGNGNGIAGATVTAQTSGTQKAVMGAAAATAQTDYAGNYTLSGLAVGSYTISASFQNIVLSTQSITISTVSSGNPVTIAPIVPTNAVTVYTVSGTITRQDLNNQPLPGVTVTFAKLDGSTGVATGATYSGVSDSTGHYGVSFTETGYYRLTPMLSGYLFGTASSDFVFLIDKSKTVDIISAAQGSGQGINFNL